MASSRDLTALDNVKSYLGIEGPKSDALLARLITAMSSAFVQAIGYEIVRQSYTETLDSDDERIRTISGWIGVAIDLKQSPVIGDPTITVDGTVVPKRASLTTTGWVLLDGYRLELDGYEFANALWRPSIAGVTIVYEAGQYVPAEAGTVPAAGPYTIQALQPYGAFLSSVSVTKVSDGSVLTKVASAPATGQYSVSASGLYTFNSAQASVAVLLSYAHLPSDVEDCVIEMVAFKFRKRERIDQNSASVGDQTVTFTRDAWPVTVQQVIDRWRRISV